MSIGSLYQYFPNKDAILVELMTAHVQAGIATTQRHLAAGLPDSLEAILRLFVRATIDNHRDAPALHRVLFEEAPRPAGVSAHAARIRGRHSPLAEALLDANPEVRVEDTHTAARLVVAAIESLVHRLIAAPTPIEVAPFENELVAMLTKYLTG